MNGERLPMPNVNEQQHSPNHPMNTSRPGQSQNNDGGQFQGVGHLEPNNSTNANHKQFSDHSNSGTYPLQQLTQQPAQGSSGNFDSSTNANHVHPPYNSNSKAFPYQQPTQQPVQRSSGNVRDSNNSTNANNELLFSGLLLFESPAQQTVQELSGNMTADFFSDVYLLQDPAQQAVQGSSGSVSYSNNATNANYVLPQNHFVAGANPLQQPVQGPSGSVSYPNNATTSNYVHAPAQPIPSSSSLQEPTQQPVQEPSEVVRAPNNATNANHEHPHSDSRFCCVEQNEQKLKQATSSGIVGDFVSSPNASHVLPQLSGPYTPQQPPAQHLVQGPSGIVHDFGSSPNANHVLPQDQFFPEPSISHQPQAVQGSSEIVGYPDSLSNPSYALPQQQFPKPSSVPVLSPVPGPFGIRGNHISSPNPNYVPPQYPCLPGPSTQQPIVLGSAGNVEEEENEKKKRKKDDSSCGSTIHVYPHMTGRPHISPWTFPTTNDNHWEWAHVLYHELTSMIDDFKATLPSFIIDGSTAATESDRYCLGSVTNVNRTEIAANVLNKIGKGIKITRKGRDVEMTLLTDSTVFVQSATHAHASRHDLSTVYKVDTAAPTMSIFNMDVFDDLLEVEMSKGEYESAHDLYYLCHAKISFVEGYGIHYPRKDIKETPCWVLIKFLEASNRLDEVWRTQASERLRNEVDSR